MANVNISNEKLATYLLIAYKQRERASKQFTDHYGAESAAVKEISAELADLNKAILELKAGSNKPTNK